MKTISFNNLVEQFCAASNCYTVSFSTGSFYDEEKEDYNADYAIFVDRINKTFDRDTALKIFGAGLFDEICVFDNLEDAMKLYDIFEASEFYSKYYAWVCGPSGAITENT